MMETRIADRTARIRGLIASLLLAAGIVLGGSSSGGAIANLGLIGLSLAILLCAVWLPSRMPLGSDERWLVWIVGAYVAISLLQLVPLPPAVWAAFPGRDAIVRGFELVGAPLPWLPASLNPLATLSSLLSVVVALAAFVAARMSPDAARGQLLWTLAIGASISILLGVAQLMGGADSPLRLYETTSRGAPVGFFANSNHLATLLVCTLPFIAVLGRASSSRRGRTETVSRLVSLGALSLFIVAGAVIAGSLAGLALLVPALLGSVVILTGKVRSRWVLVGGIVALAAFGAVVLVAAHSDMLSGFGATSLGEGQTGRPVIFATTAHAIATFFPAGTGLGSFVDIYPWFENAAKVDRIFVNHAHNDYLEFVLEMGLPGALLILAFLIWWARRAAQIWLGRGEGPLARAAALASGMILAHSAVDYPLRTGAVLIVFAMSIALMLRAPVVPAAAVKVRAKGRHLSVG